MTRDDERSPAAPQDVTRQENDTEHSFAPDPGRVARHALVHDPRRRRSRHPEASLRQLHYGNAVAGQPVLGCPDRNPTHFVRLERPLIGCVWELPPILHERDAWVRHMLAPDRPGLGAYLADTLPEGTTGDRR